MRARDRRGFTLLELLVVVAIVLMLMGLLLPSLREARERARVVACQDNIRNIWTGILAYALENDDRAPFLEDVNLDDPAHDPFDPSVPTTIGVVLGPYVNPGSWVCPSAIDGFPRIRPGEQDLGPWKLTYRLDVDKKIGEQVPFDENELRGTGTMLDPLISNYEPFDGRPIRWLDGRRYLVPPFSASGVNPAERNGFEVTWNIREPLIADRLLDEKLIDGVPVSGRYLYPHRARLDPRHDLQNAEEQFRRNANIASYGIQTGYNELHADGERVRIFFTRTYRDHADGY